ncbi:MAG TPA: OmpA family protein [Bacteroidales bacterium]|nr:OmpA family protein [Bacteroidales bacterium]
MTILLIVSITAVCFTNEDLPDKDKDKYKLAEKYLMYDNFEDALTIYLILFNKDSENYNTAYKIGYCYLSGETCQDIPSAIKYLEFASKGVDKNYKNSFKEKSAPLFCWYYLGVAYRFNKDYSQAIDAFTQYQNLLDKKESKSVRGEFIDREIQSCYDALQGIDEERMKVERLVVNNLNEPNVRCPILCVDTNRLIFTNGKQNTFPPDINWGVEYSSGPFDGVYSAIRNTEGFFDLPESIDKDLQIPFPYIPVTATADGSELYLVVDKNDNGDIYMSKYEDGRYQRAERVKEICTKQWESHATITADGKRIYFTSARKGGFGGLDIWYSDRDEEGLWQKPVNIGDVINTPYNEEMPYIIRNGHALYFSSEGHKNMGGYDMFYSNFNEETNSWSTPINLGYPFSTVGNDMGYIIENTPIFAFCPVNDNKWRDGVEDCECISLIDEEAPLYASISGIIQLDPSNKELLMRTGVKLLEKITDIEVANQIVDDIGYYRFDSIKAGSYDIVVYVENIEMRRTSIDVPQNMIWNIEGINMIIRTTEILALNDINISKDTVLVDNTIITNDTLIVDNNIITNDTISNDDTGLHVQIITDTIKDPNAVYIENILFDFDQYTIRPCYFDNLDKLADYMKKNPEAKIDIAGHTDWIGTNEYNYVLSNNRAKSVKNYLVSLGVNPNNISTQYFGEDRPIASNVHKDGSDNPVGRQFNRRSEFEVMKQGSTAILAIIPLNPGAENTIYNQIRYINEKAEADKYTIQLFALKNKQPLTNYPDLTGLKLSSNGDGWHRYYIGEYNSLEDALNNVEVYRAKGYNPIVRNVGFFEK